MREASRKRRLTNNLPLGTVLAPEPDTVLSTSDAILVVKMDHADTKVLSSLLDLAICLPHVGAEGLGGRIVGAVSETSRVGDAVG